MPSSQNQAPQEISLLDDNSSSEDASESLSLDPSLIPTPSASASALFEQNYSTNQEASSSSSHQAGQNATPNTSTHHISASSHHHNSNAHHQLNKPNRVGDDDEDDEEDQNTNQHDDDEEDDIVLVGGSSGQTPNAGGATTAAITPGLNSGLGSSQQHMHPNTPRVNDTASSANMKAPEAPGSSKSSQSQQQTHASNASSHSADSSATSSNASATPYHIKSRFLFQQKDYTIEIFRLSWHFNLVARNQKAFRVLRSKNHPEASISDQNAAHEAFPSHADLSKQSPKERLFYFLPLPNGTDQNSLQSLKPSLYYSNASAGSFYPSLKIHNATPSKSPNSASSQNVSSPHAYQSDSILHKYALSHLTYSEYLISGSPSHSISSCALNLNACGNFIEWSDRNMIAFTSQGYETVLEELNSTRSGSASTATPASPQKPQSSVSINNKQLLYLIDPNDPKFHSVFITAHKTPIKHVAHNSAVSGAHDLITFDEESVMVWNTPHNTSCINDLECQQLTRLSGVVCLKWINYDFLYINNGKKGRHNADEKENPIKLDPDAPVSAPSARTTPILDLTDKYEKRIRYTAGVPHGRSAWLAVTRNGWAHLQYRTFMDIKGTKYQWFTSRLNLNSQFRLVDIMPMSDGQILVAGCAPHSTLIYIYVLGVHPNDGLTYSLALRRVYSPISALSGLSHTESASKTKAHHRQPNSGSNTSRSINNHVIYMRFCPFQPSEEPQLVVCTVSSNDGSDSDATKGFFLKRFSLRKKSNFVRLSKAFSGSGSTDISQSRWVCTELVKLATFPTCIQFSKDGQWLSLGYLDGKFEIRLSNQLSQIIYENDSLRKPLDENQSDTATRGNHVNMNQSNSECCSHNDDNNERDTKRRRLNDSRSAGSSSSKPSSDREESSSATYEESHCNPITGISFSPSKSMLVVVDSECKLHFIVLPIFKPTDIPTLVELSFVNHHDWWDLFYLFKCWIVDGLYNEVKRHVHTLNMNKVSRLTAQQKGLTFYGKLYERFASIMCRLLGGFDNIKSIQLQGEILLPIMLKNSHYLTDEFEKHHSKKSEAALLESSTFQVHRWTSMYMYMWTIHWAYIFLHQWHEYFQRHPKKGQTKEYLHDLTRFYLIVETDSRYVEKYALMMRNHKAHALSVADQNASNLIKTDPAMKALAEKESLKQLQEFLIEYVKLQKNVKNSHMSQDMLRTDEHFDALKTLVQGFYSKVEKPLSKVILNSKAQLLSMHMDLVPQLRGRLSVRDELSIMRSWHKEYLKDVFTKERMSKNIAFKFCRICSRATLCIALLPLPVASAYQACPACGSHWMLN